MCFIGYASLLSFSRLQLCIGIRCREGSVFLEHEEEPLARPRHDIIGPCCELTRIVAISISPMQGERTHWVHVSSWLQPPRSTPSAPGSEGGARHLSRQLGTLANDSRALEVEREALWVSPRRTSRPGLHRSGRLASGPRILEADLQLPLILSILSTSVLQFAFLL